MKNILFSLIFFLTISHAIYPQKKVDIWYFQHRAGIRFDTSGISLFTDHKMGESTGGSATMTDDEGNLLFYTDGKKVWNREHRIMENGDSLSTHGLFHNVLIVPLPGNPNHYYILQIVITRYENNKNDFLYGSDFLYSIVDMKGDAGKGTLVAKNQIITNSVTFRLNTVGHANGNDIWILTQKYNSNSFLAYLLTDKGFQNLPSPVQSNAGVTHSKFAVWGNLNVNPQGNILAVALPNIVHQNKLFELYKFSPKTGKISEPLTFYEEGSRAYSVSGIEFSPDGTKLYCVTYDRIYQYDIQKYDPHLIQHSKKIIFDASLKTVQEYEDKFDQKDSLKNNPEFIRRSNQNIFHTSMVNPRETYNQFTDIRLGPNGHIYIAQKDSPFLSIIKSPNLSGDACEFVYQGIIFKGRKVLWYLPNIPKFLYSFDKND